MTRRKGIEITFPETIAFLCAMQNRFVKAWNEAEINCGIGQTHDLPGGARYGAANRNVEFHLPLGTIVRITANPPWHSWHGGWSFCRHSITSAQVRKIELIGIAAEFYDWLKMVKQPCEVKK